MIRVPDLESEFVSMEVVEDCRRLLEMFKTRNEIDAAFDPQNVILWEGQRAATDAPNRQPSSDGSTVQPPEPTGREDGGGANRVLEWKDRRAVSLVWPMPARFVRRNVSTRS